MLRAMKLAIIGVLLAALAPAPVSAQALQGNDLWARCKGEPIGAACSYYVGGVTDGLAAAGGLSACVPNGVTYEQVADIVRKYLEANPAMRHNGAAFLVHRALRKGFPCPVD